MVALKSLKPQCFNSLPLVLSDFCNNLYNSSRGFNKNNVHEKCIEVNYIYNCLSSLTLHFVRKIISPHIYCRHSNLYPYILLAQSFVL